MKSILTVILFFILTGAAYPQTVYDIGHASLGWKHVWIESGDWIDQSKTFPSFILYCNKDFPNAVVHTVTAPTMLVKFLDFIKVPGDYTCHVTVIHNSGNETAPSPSIKFSAAWVPPAASDLKIIITGIPGQ